MDNPYKIVVCDIDYQLALLSIVLISMASASIYLQLLEYTLGIPIFRPKALDTLFLCYRFSLSAGWYFLVFRNTFIMWRWARSKFGEDAQFSRPYSDRIVKVTHDDKWIPEEPSFMTREDAETWWGAMLLENGTFILRDTKWEPNKYKYVFVDITGFLEWDDNGVDLPSFEEFRKAYHILFEQYIAQQRRKKEELEASGGCLTPLKVLGIKIERINNDIYLIYLFYMWTTLKALDNIERFNKYCPFFVQFVVATAAFTKWYWAISGNDIWILNDPDHQLWMKWQAFDALVFWLPKLTLWIWWRLKLEYKMEQLLFQNILHPVWAQYNEWVDRKVKELEGLEKAGETKWNDAWGRKL
ncbi:hypothetical protein BDZ45DRAFT_792639 [Acephala macrosclerotiorum]|nr:hypothetical protein BDZ45DRAFT_792639 [Acephala macrosclerotiorum]